MPAPAQPCAPSSGAEPVARVLLTRPSAQSQATARRLEALGHRAIIAPLLQPEPLGWAVPPSGFEAVIVSSANALRPGDRALEGLLALPAYAVGAASAEAARAAGFQQVRVPGSGGIAALLAALAADPAAPRRLLHLAARERTPVDVPAGLHLSIVETYRTALLPLTPAAADLLARGAIGVALLYSARTAAQLAAEVDRLRIARRLLAVAALSPEVAAAAGPGWSAVHVATEPSEEELLSAAGLLGPAA